MENNRAYTEYKFQYITQKLGEGSICHAEYVKQSGRSEGNIFIEALPASLSESECDEWYTRPISSPSSEELAKMNDMQKLDSLDTLDSFRVELPFHLQLDHGFRNILRNGYTHRVLKKSDTMSVDLHVQGKDQKQFDRMVPRNQSKSVMGMAVIGIGGSGKSEAVNRMLDRYPQVILHECENGNTMTQIVYLKISAQPNSNMSSLWTAFGMALDDALGNIEPYYSKIIDRTPNARRYMKIISYIEFFHIGALIIDEVQLFKNVNSNNVETFETLSNQTGIAIMLVGTSEAYDKIFDSLHTARRESIVIFAEEYKDSKDMFECNLLQLWDAQWTPKKLKYTKQIGNYIYERTNGLIGLLLLFWLSLQVECIEKHRIVATKNDFLKVGEERLGHLTQALENEKMKLDGSLFMQAYRHEISDAIRKNFKPKNAVEERSKLKAKFIEELSIYHPEWNERIVSMAFDNVYDNDSNIKSQKALATEVMKEIQKLLNVNDNAVIIEKTDETISKKEKRTERKQKDNEKEVTELRKELEQFELHI